MGLLAQRNLSSFTFHNEVARILLLYSVHPSERKFKKYALARWVTVSVSKFLQSLKSLLTHCLMLNVVLLVAGQGDHGAPLCRPRAAPHFRGVGGNVTAEPERGR